MASDENGLYTFHLLQNLAQPNVDILRAFQRTRAAVVSASGGKQTPWESTSLIGDLYLRPPRPGDPMASASAQAEGPFDGVWAAKDARWQVSVTVEQGRASGLSDVLRRKRGSGEVGDLHSPSICLPPANPLCHGRTHVRMVATGVIGHFPDHFHCCRERRTGDLSGWHDHPAARELEGALRFCRSIGAAANDSTCLMGSTSTSSTNSDGRAYSKQPFRESVTWRPQARNAIAATLR